MLRPNNREKKRISKQHTASSSAHPRNAQPRPSVGHCARSVGPEPRPPRFPDRSVAPSLLHSPNPQLGRPAVVAANMVAQKHTTAERIQALALIEEGVAVDRVTTVSGMSKASIYRLQKTARARGYDPTVSRKLKDEYVQDAPRSGRPKKLSPEQEQHLLEVLQNNRNPGTGNTPEKTMQQLASEAGISSVSVYRIMRKHGLQKPKAVGGGPGATPASAPATAPSMIPNQMPPQTPTPAPQVAMQGMPTVSMAQQVPMQAPMQAPMQMQTPVPLPGTMQGQIPVSMAPVSMAAPVTMQAPVTMAPQATMAPQGTVASSAAPVAQMVPS